jgi:hypothetical protein
MKKKQNKTDRRKVITHLGIKDWKAGDLLVRQVNVSVPPHE